MRSDKKIYDYWQERANNLVHYRGETFYTITSLPFYIKRREEMLVLFNREIGSILLRDTQPIVLDFGCGDGKYSILIKQLYPQCKVYGCDLSTNMIQQAQLNANQEDVEIQFGVFDSKIPFNELFDVIFINAVFAHIDTSLLDRIVNNITTHLRKDGKIIIFEQTALVPRHGDTWYRRTEKFYEDLFSCNGLELIQKNIISHRTYDRFDRYLRQSLFRYHKNPNKSSLYLYLCEILMRLTYIHDKQRLHASEGNTFFVFKKAGEKAGESNNE